ncbi:MAG TPA: Smr/MutS family protein [Thermoanaerobaculia bacterium]|nr:Smr/MutS family protein [Thermoanaerobaculia bacterium]
MPFAPGDLVHVAALGKGTVREARNGERYLVEVKGRSLVVTGGQLTMQAGTKKLARPKSGAASRPPQEYEGPPTPPASLDLHGNTVAEALEAVIAFLNSALLSGASEVRLIHGRSGGKIKAALHAQLKGMRSIRSIRVDPANAGVTIVEL